MKHGGADELNDLPYSSQLTHDGPIPWFIDTLLHGLLIYNLITKFHARISLALYIVSHTARAASFTRAIDESAARAEDNVWQDSENRFSEVKDFLLNYENNLRMTCNLTVNWDKVFFSDPLLLL